MENELYDKPGLVIVGDNITRTTKVKKWISKNKPTDYKIIYLDPIPSDFREVERELKNLENSYLGIDSIKKVEEHTPTSRPKYEYRLNLNTVLVGYNEESLNTLKRWYGIID